MAYTSITEILEDGKDYLPKQDKGVLVLGTLGEEVLAANNYQEIPEEMKPDIFLLDLFLWTGSQVIADGAWFNYFALPGITKQPNGTANLSIVGGNLLFPVRQKNTQVMFSVRISGTISGGAGTAREWRTQTRRTDGATIVGSDPSTKVQGLDITNRDAVLASYTLGPTDPFMVTGIQLGMNNISGQTITLTSVSVRMMQTVNPE
ncbi:protease [Salmonella enterica subsp. enterica serovar Newport]|nr:protease [Salmonella enterica subsp. enterica serovar Newport]